MNRDIFSYARRAVDAALNLRATHASAIDALRTTTRSIAKTTRNKTKIRRLHNFDRNFIKYELVSTVFFVVLSLCSRFTSVTTYTKRHSIVILYHQARRTVLVRVVGTKRVCSG